MKMNNYTYDELHFEIARRDVIREASSEELLLELIRRSPIPHHKTPPKRAFHTPHVDICVGIGKDHTADITLDVDSLVALEELVNR